MEYPKSNEHKNPKFKQFEKNTSKEKNDKKNNEEKSKSNQNKNNKEIKSKIQVKVVKGARDFLPYQMAIRDMAFNIIKGIFKIMELWKLIHLFLS